MGLLASFAVLNDTFAEGGKNQKKNPVFDSDGNLVGIVTPLRCTQLVNLESGETGWFCPDVESDD